MDNFVFHNPTKIIFGRDTIAKIGTETAAFGRKVLLVSGRSSCKKNGTYQQVATSLDAVGLEVIEHAGVCPNPTLSQVRQGIILAKTNKVEAIVALGGGSVIDSAKAICAGALVEHDVWKFFIGKKSITDTLPLTCVLTLAGSGSEMNGGMVLTNEDKGLKFGFGNRLLHPRTSILDPGATVTVPREQTIYGAVDAISHVLELYFTTREPQTPVQDRIMEGLVLTIMESCERVLDDETDYQARADFMWAATLALNGLTAAGLGKVGFPMHLIEHPLSALYDIPHGAGLAVVIPAWLSWRARDDPDRLARFAERIFNITGGSGHDRARAGINRLKNWFKQLDLPASLDELQVQDAAIPELADKARAQARIWRMHDYSEERIAKILVLCLKKGPSGS